MWVTIDETQTAVNILTCMNNAGFSPKRTATELNVTVQTVYNWIRGNRLPDYENLIALSVIFNVKIDDLLSYKY